MVEVKLLHSTFDETISFPLPFEYIEQKDRNKELTQKCKKFLDEEISTPEQCKVMASVLFEKMSQMQLSSTGATNGKSGESLLSQGGILDRSNPDTFFLYDKLIIYYMTKCYIILFIFIILIITIIIIIIKNHWTTGLIWIAMPLLHDHFCDAGNWLYPSVLSSCMDS